MKNLPLLACLLGTLVITLIGPGCVSTSSEPALVREPRTYAIIAADDQGPLSQAESNSIENSLVQFLLDQGYVGSDQTLVMDTTRAATVFRIMVAWNVGRTSFAIVSVTPGLGRDDAGAAPSPAYAAPGPQPYAPPSYDDWDDSPWSQSNTDGYAFNPYYPFFAVFPFVTYYGSEHHRQHSHQGIHHTPGNRPFSDGRPPAWEHGRRPVPAGPVANEPRPPLTRQDASNPRPQNHGARYSGDQDHLRHQSPPAEHDRPVPQQQIPVARARPEPRSDRHSTPDHPSRSGTSNVSPAPLNVAPRASAPSPAATSTRGPTPSQRSSPPSRQDSIPSPSHSTSLPSAARPAPSPKSGDDSKPHKSER
jgi:hypothetical protein